MTLKAVAVAARQARRVPRVDVSAPTREVILDTAEHLFAERGVDGVALRDLAREMGLTAPSFYNHFPSKQALYDAVLDRGARPIADLMVEAWRPGALAPDRLHAAVDKLIVHLSAHPHLAPLLQRALLDQPKRFRARVARWLDPLYREGLALVRETADFAGWERTEVPHLAIGLFGMVFAYFINAAVLQTFAAWTADPLSPDSLAVQRRVVEKAVHRLLGPRPRAAARRRKA